MIAPNNRLAELELVIAVIDGGSFSEAARSTGRTASAISKAIARLEDRLGVALFHRTTRRVAPTEAGAAFAQRGRAIVAELSALERDMAADRPEGLVRIATSGVYARFLLAPLLKRFHADYPDIRLELCLSDRVSSLAEAGIDVAIRAGPLPDSSLYARSLGDAELVRAGHNPGLPFFGLSYARIDAQWRQVPAPFLANDGAAIIAAVRAGTAQGIVPRFAIRDLLESGDLTILDPAARFTEPFHIVYTGRAAGLPSRVEILIQFLARWGSVT
ncbi:LysR family transcriptional regulator [Alteriqipengyuania sp. 357]